MRILLATIAGGLVLWSGGAAGACTIISRPEGWHIGKTDVVVIGRFTRELSPGRKLGPENWMLDRTDNAYRFEVDRVVWDRVGVGNRLQVETQDESYDDMCGINYGYEPELDAPVRVYLKLDRTTRSFYRVVKVEPAKAATP